MLHTALSKDQPPEMRVLCQVSVKEEEYVWYYTVRLQSGLGRWTTLLRWQSEVLRKKKLLPIFLASHTGTPFSLVNPTAVHPKLKSLLLANSWEDEGWVLPSLPGEPVALAHVFICVFDTRNAPSQRPATLLWVATSHRSAKSMSRFSKPQSAML